MSGKQLAIFQYFSIKTNPICNFSTRIHPFNENVILIFALEIDAGY